MPDRVPASEFTRDFGQHRPQAQRAPVAVSSHGEIADYFVGPEESAEFKRFQDARRNFATVDLSEEKVRAIGASRMESRHAHLDGMIEE